jgi:type I site-specific restriction endonuclease
VRLPYQDNLGALIHEPTFKEAAGEAVFSKARLIGRRPLIFYSNGYTPWLWDDANYPPRQVQGFYKKDELELGIQRRVSRKPLAEAEIDPAIVERYYQTRAIRRIAEAFERDHDRKALVVMATGSARRSCSPRTRPTPNSSPSGSTRTTPT